MQRLPSTGRASRPKPVQSSKSFTRFEPLNPDTTPRRRASTAYDSPTLSPTEILTSIPPFEPPPNTRNDIFEKHEEEEFLGDTDEEAEITPTTAESTGQLPPEIQALVDNFLESLAAKVHPTPLSIERLSQLFQDFYEHAYDHINTYINLLATRNPSGLSSTPSLSSASSVPPTAGTRKSSKSQTKLASRTKTANTEQQMLTPSEIASRRKVRRVLELKRLALEEAVERTICETVYPRIWRHRSTDDEARDEKLRSRAAALALVGVDLHELLSTAMGSDIGSTSKLQLDEAQGDSARARLAGARESLQRMNDDRYPLGKLSHLKAAHQSIVETLQQIFPSTSSADEVLPTLIFTIIISDPQSSHTVSNFNFVQRFRASTKVDGEAAYCLTNLEAAITFLETVDLSSLRADETPEGPLKPANQSGTPRTETPDPMYHGLPSDSPRPATVIDRTTPTPSSSDRLRGLSLVTPARHRPFEAHSDAVLKKADEAIDTLHNALDGSFKFLFGRLRERQVSSSPLQSVHNSPSPKTLEDARILISSPSPQEPDDASLDGSSVAEHTEDIVASSSPYPDNSEDNTSRVLQLIGGRRPRERSLDSERSAVSGESGSRKVSFVEGSSPAVSTTTNAMPKLHTAIAGRARTDRTSKGEAITPSTALSPGSLPNSVTFPLSSHPPTTPSAYTAVESMRNLGTTLNPLRGLSAGMGMMRGFGRTPSNPTSTPPAATASSPNPMDGGAATPTIDLNGVAPPVQRFVDCKDVRELSGFEIELLLRDYQRLTGVLRALREGG